MLKYSNYRPLKRYRDTLHPEVDSAIEDIISEPIVSDLNDSPVEIELSNLNASDKVKDIIRTEFQFIKEMLDDKKSHEIFRNWYVDGRLYYHKVLTLQNLKRVSRNFVTWTRESKVCSWTKERRKCR